MTIARMCELGHVSRAGLYRFDPNREQPDNDLDLRNEIQKIALEFPCYGPKAFGLTPPFMVSNVNWEWAEQDGQELAFSADQV